MNELSTTDNQPNFPERCLTVSKWVGSNIEGMGKVLLAFGITTQSHIMLVSGLLMSLALKFMDVQRLKELETELSTIRQELGSRALITWNEENIRELFMRLELFMKENFDVKRQLLRDVIKRFVGGEQAFSNDEAAYFMRITTDLTPSDVEYLKWALHEGQLVDSQKGGIAKKAHEDPNAKRNLHSLIGLGLIESTSVWGGNAYHLTPIAYRYFQFLTGETISPPVGKRDSEQN